MGENDDGQSDRFRLDQPERVPPAPHLWTSHSLPWVRFGDQLPQVEEGAPSVSKSKKATLADGPSVMKFPGWREERLIRHNVSSAGNEGGNMAEAAKQVRIRAHNPYLHRATDRHLITRDTLQLIKLLRAQGIDAVVEPGAKEPHYVVRKGVIEFLQQPLVLILIGVPISIVTGVIANWITEQLRITRQAAPESSETNIVLETRESGTTVRFDHRGEKIDDAQFNRVMELFNRVHEASRFPDWGKPGYDRPLYLEHTNKIVGWTKLIGHGDATRAECVITDDDTWERWQKGELRGFSIAGIVEESTCSICKRDYKACNHVTGRYYDGKECVNHIERLTLTDVSIVRDPINRECIAHGPQRTDEGSKRSRKRKPHR
jgi:hypothetical protein